MANELFTDFSEGESDLTQDPKLTPPKSKGLNEKNTAKILEKITTTELDPINIAQD